MDEMYKQKFLLDALECLSIIRKDVPQKLECLKLPKENLVTFCLSLEKEDKARYLTVRDELIRVIKNVVESRTGTAVIIEIDEGLLEIVTNIFPKTPANIEKKKTSLELAYLIKENIEKRLDVTINIGVSHVFNGHNGLGLAHNESAIALEDRFYREPGVVVHVDDMCGLVLTNISSEMIAFIEAANFKSARDRLDCFYSYMRKNIRNDTHLYKRLAMNLMVQIYQHLLEVVNNGDMDEMINIMETYKTMEECTAFEDIYKITESYIEKTTSYLKRLRFKKYEVLVKRALGYINLHYGRNIGVSDVATYIGISASYFTKIFKQYTSKSFVQYLTEYRIERAKKLLLSPDVKVYEVASLVGFNDEKYFNRIFKANTGRTPSDYKKEHVSSN